MPPDHQQFVRQRAAMRLFAALILNVDNHPGNQLYTTKDWKLHLIDHSRSFRMQRSLPKEFARNSIQIPRGLHAALASLDKQELETLLHGLLSKARVRALLARRDAIMEKVDRDRKEFGEAFVFLEETPPVDR